MDLFSANRPRVWHFQFSLRLLLLAFTAFAIGFPIWYRWPYQETFEAPSGARRITTWQRQWGGRRVKHGPERWVVDDYVIESVMYRNGLRHGPYDSGKFRFIEAEDAFEAREGVHGQFVNDLKDGLWTEAFRTSTWRRGKLDGPMEIRVAASVPEAQKRWLNNDKLAPGDARTIKLLFEDGRLTQLDGKPLTLAGKSAAGRLFELQESGVLDDRLHSELGKPSQVDFVEVPPRDAFLYLSELHGLPIVVDPKVDPDSKMAITANYQGADLASILLLLAAPHNLGCDYRYGSLWITTADDCGDWRDPTGIEKIKPPRGSALARAWVEPMGFDFNLPTPLKPTLASIEEKMGISIDTSRVPEAEAHPPPSSMPPGPWTPNAAMTVGTIRARQLRHVLGHVLYKCGCRCELDGDKLLILPPE